MARYSGNKDVFIVDGVDLSFLWCNVKVTQKADSTDVSAGSNITHRQRNVGLLDAELSFEVVYDDAYYDTVFPVLKPGKHMVIWGPEGATAGKPKHQQEFVFESIDTEGDFEKKKKRVFSGKGTAAEAPIFDMFNGDRF